MKKHFLFSALTFMFCLFLTNVDAQCKKSKTSCTKSKTEEATQTKKSSCAEYRSYSSCKEYRKTSCNKKKNNPFYYTDNYVMVLGGANLDGDNQVSAATGLEYERKLTNTIGVGALAEVNFLDDPVVKVGLPLSVHLNQNIRLIASPLMAFQQNTLDKIDPTTKKEKEWVTDFGARLGLSYMMNVHGLVVAPIIRADYLNSDIVPGFGVNIGFGF